MTTRIDDKTGSSNHHLFPRRGVLAAAGGVLAMPSIARAQGQSGGVALVVGNSKYEWEASLPNVKRDTPDVAKAFQALGLKTEFLQDLRKGALKQAIDRFAAAARGAKLAAFYFAGHGVTWDDESYVVPVDANLGDPRAVLNLTPVHSVIGAMTDAASRLLVFDSCRNNPADGWKQRKAAEARTITVDKTVEAARAPNTLVLFSTAPGRVALDGPPGDYSPFASSFLRELDSASIDLQALPARLRRRLLLATQGRQVLWDHGTYLQPFHLRRASASPANTARPSADSGGRVSLIELPNAYSFAQQFGLEFPPGLVALRPGDGSPHAEKIGSYKYTVGLRAPGTNQINSVPAMFVVLSVANNVAEVVFTGRFGAGGKPSHWRYVTEALSGSRMSVLTSNESIKVELNWTNRDSGNYSSRSVGSASAGYTSSFSRLDG